ncbi:hypothetical protein LRS10_09550 [Phenylobacterium sp. J426]|uniref:hypothetical protein n=1 Tax=Phenylobacterium sp. J426 TaxID=2898439 RepID=UPI0021515109|nr:hypothetical protein [Phenylobacterium sp. J426]MCR5874387.1 hypothetical protein [Phenylobacterium sp. J426]
MKLANSPHYSIADQPEGAAAAERTDASPQTGAYAAAQAALAAARTEDAKRRERYDAVGAALDAAAPLPAILQEREGKTRFTSTLMIEMSDHPFERKVEMVAALNDWLPKREAAKAELDYGRISDDYLSFDVAAVEDAVIESAPETPTELAHKLGLAASIILEVDPEQLETPEGLSAILSRRDRADTAVVRVYQDALRLAGARPDLVAAQPFDVEAWIDTFEAHPGHLVTESGRVEYQEPLAWGAPDEAELLISDPEAIERYNAWVRSHYSDEDWEASERAGTTGWAGKPFIPAQVEAIHAAYPEGPERERLLALWELRHERLTGEPLGAHLWRDLADWQKEAVRAYCRDNPLSFPASWRWDASEWLEAFEEAGGVIVKQPGGGFMAGADVPGSFETRRLMRHLDKRLRAAVADLLKSREHCRTAERPLAAAE